MPVRSCLVSFLDPEGLRHSVEVQAETLYEAAALALSIFHGHECLPGTAANLEIEMRTAVVHTLSLRKIQQWLEGAAKSPKEAVLKKQLRQSLTR